MMDFLNEKVMGDWFPFLTMGVGLYMLAWLFFLGDLVMG